MRNSESASKVRVGMYTLCILPHGNRKRTAQLYIRTDPDVLAKIRDSDKGESNRHVSAQLLDQNPMNAPRNSQQVRKIRSKSKIQKLTPTPTNLAEEVLCSIKYYAQSSIMLKSRTRVYFKCEQVACILVCILSFSLR